MNWEKILLIIALLSFGSCVDQITNSEDNSGSTSNEQITQTICRDLSNEQSPISFNGLDSIDIIYQKEVKLNWSPVNGAAGYIIKEVTANGEKILKFANHGRGWFKIKNLTPNTTYMYKVTMMDKDVLMDSNDKKVTVTTPAYPAYANAVSLNFDGSKNVVLPESNKLIPQKKRFTISAWIRPSVQQNDRRVINFHRTSGAGTAINIGLRNNHVFLGYRDAGGNYREDIKHSVAYVDGSWHHVAVTYLQSNSGGQLKLYWDGALVDQKSDMITDIGVTPAHIGAYHGTNKGYIGLIDEVSIWNVRMNSNHIQSLYNGGTPNSPAEHARESNLIAWYRLGDDASDGPTLIKDQHTKGLDGTPNGVIATDFVSDSP